MKKNKIYYVTDPGYAIPSAVSAYSIRKYHPVSEVPITIISYNFSEEQKTYYNKLADDIGFEIIYGSESDLNDFKEVDLEYSHVPITAFSKFLISKYADDHENVIYIDGDTWASSSINELLKLTIPEDKIIAAPDYAWFCRANIIGDYGRKIRSYFNAVNVTQFYFNTGVFLVSTKYLKNLSRQAKELLKSEKSKQFLFQDQSLFNASANSNLIPLSIKYNYQQYFWKFNLKNAKILHFSGPAKPWYHKDLSLPEDLSDYFDIHSRFYSELFPSKTWSDCDLRNFNKTTARERLKEVTIFLIRTSTQKLRILNFERKKGTP